MTLPDPEQSLDDLLFEAQCEGHEWVRDLITEAIKAPLVSKDLEARLRYVLSSDDRLLKGAALRGIEVLGPRIARFVPDLITLLNDTSVAVRGYAAHCLVAIGPSCGSDVLRSLRSGDLESPRWGLAIVGALGATVRGAAAIVIPFLDQAEAHLRAEAAECLGRMGSKAKSSVPRLLTLLESEKNEEVLARTIEALGLIKCTEGLVAKSLAPMLGHYDQVVRWCTSQALARLGKSGVDVLISGLASKNRDIRQNSAYGLTLSARKPRAAIPPLVSALCDREPSVRAAAGRALASFGRDAVHPLCEMIPTASPLLRRNICHALAFMGPDASEALPIMIGLFDDADPLVSIRAALVVFAIDPNNSDAASKVTMAAVKHDDSSMSHDAITAIVNNAQVVTSYLKSLATDLRRDLAERARALHLLNQISPTEVASVFLNGQDVAWDAEALTLHNELLLFLEVESLYRDGATSFREVARRLADRLILGKARAPLPVSVSEVTRCIDTMNSFFARVFDSPDLQLFDAPKGAAARPTKACAVAREWTEAFLGRHRGFMESRLKQARDGNGNGSGETRRLTDR